MPPKMGCGSLWGETQAYIDRMTRALRVAVGLVFPVVGAALGCGDGSAPGLTPRPFLMGFSALPPRMDSTIVVPAINFWEIGRASCRERGEICALGRTLRKKSGEVVRSMST